MTNNYQRAVAKIVEQQVIYNISPLIVDLSPHAQMFEHLTGDKLANAYQGEFKTMEDEDENTEIFEHWLVTEWFSEKLEAKGEKIIQDLFGLTIWCRTTTGQSICMDSVICDIYDDIFKFNNMKEE